MDPEPAMPAANPTPADLARYNAWADRNGRPRFGAPEAPAAPPAAPAAAPKRRGRHGLPVPAPPAHGQVVVDSTGGGWRRGTDWSNRTEYAYKTNGQKRKLRTFNSRTGEYKWFAAGRDYYDHNRQQFIINVPCLGYIPPEKTNAMKAALIGILANRTVAPANTAAKDPNAEGTEGDDPLVRSTFYGKFQSTNYIPLDPEAYGAVFGDRPTAIARLGLSLIHI